MRLGHRLYRRLASARERPTSLDQAYSWSTIPQLCRALADPPAIGTYSIQGRLVRADLIQYWKIMHGKSCISPCDMFQLPSDNRTRGHRLKLFYPSVNTDVRKRFFSVRRVHLWNSLPALAVCAPALNTFKRMLNEHIHDILYAFTD